MIRIILEYNGKYTNNLQYYQININNISNCVTISLYNIAFMYYNKSINHNFYLHNGVEAILWLILL